MLDNEVYNKDIFETVKRNIDILKEFNDASILITGSTGFIGSFLVNIFILFNIHYNGRIKIIAVLRNIEKAKKLFLDVNTVVIINENIENINVNNEKYDIDYIFHCASPTSSKYFVTNPVETLHTAYIGTKNILDIALRSKVKSMIFLSSLEVYGAFPEEKDKISENDYGIINIDNIRNSYSEGKRIAECLCYSYAHEYYVPIKIGRLTQIMGSGIEYSDNRVFAEFARNVVENNNIILHTNGNTKRNYCYISDAVTAIMIIALKGNIGEAYNIANKDNYISIKKLAERFVDLYKDNDLSVNYDIKDPIDFGYNPEIKINLDAEKLELLNWKAEVSLDDMIIRTINYMKNAKKTYKIQYR
ncbi:MAG: NAD-dependent epimerase/dehydratase family protein [Firmicutes bacterium]|nr:NAD-dependent epimerase/dehydratase family protein [Bacillota bacterium]